MFSEALNTLVGYLTLEEGLDSTIFKCCMLGYCMFIANNLSQTHWSQKGPLLNFGMLLVVAYGGGFLAPILLGMDAHFPFVLAQDFSFLTTGVAFIICRYWSGWADFHSNALVKGLLAVLFEAIRAKTLFHWWTVANEIIPKSYFETPVFGPLVIGALGGCGGLVFLFGREFLNSPAPLNWLVVSALIASSSLTLLTTGLLDTTASFFQIEHFTIEKRTCHALIALYFIETRLVKTFKKKESQ
jgi:hypothetical protein